jgi:hypothetical protein
LFFSIISKGLEIIYYYNRTWHNFTTTAIQGCTYFYLFPASTLKFAFFFCKGGNQLIYYNSSLDSWSAIITMTSQTYALSHVRAMEDYLLIDSDALFLDQFGWIEVWSLPYME